MECYKVLVMYKIFFLMSCCHGFSLVSSAASGGAGHTGFLVGKPSRVYSLESSVLLNDVDTGGKAIGYMITGTVHVGAIWDNEAGEKILKMKLDSPRLHIKSSKSPSSSGFVEHSSPLDSMQGAPVYLLWRQGGIQSIYMDEKTPVGLANLNKGIASLLQFQVLDMEANETDVSGFCNAVYMSTSPSSMRKTKKNCVLPTQSQNKIHPERILSALTETLRTTDYYMSADNTVLNKIISKEVYTMKMAIKQEAGNTISVVQKMELDEGERGESVAVKGASAKDVIAQLVNQGEDLKEQKLMAVREQQQCQGDCPTLATLIKDNRDLLKSSNLGTIESATVFLKMLNVARQSTADEILKGLKGIKNKEILQQLCDLVGFTQTIASHQAAKKFFHFDSDYDVENTERYLWALSMGAHPHEEIIRDVLKISEGKNIAKKLFETLVLTPGAMANRFALQHPEGFQHKIVAKVKNSILHHLSKCKDNKCKVMYIRALKNLKHPETVKLLLNLAENGQRSVSVAAMKSLKGMPKTYWDKSVLTACNRIFYQMVRKFDSSSRTIAVDILLQSEPSQKDVEQLLIFLTKYEKEYEVKQFLYQRLLMIADKCPRFHKMMNELIKAERKVNNWHVLAQRGLTTAFQRSFMDNEWSNGSLVTIQEISGGILKRGHVDVIIDSNGEEKELFSLGVFGGGLSSFLGGSDSGEDGSSKDEDEEEEQTCAGMELTVQGVQLRPFTFFTSQGELMGHVWSGTASDRTTAFQAISLLQEHSELLVLGTGVTAELTLQGATSFDLNGQIQLSIWNRIAHSLIEKNAGVVVRGSLKADSSFIRSQVEFLVSSEPKLHLVSDIDFYSDISLCIQVKQPDTTLMHNIFKTESIPGSKHKVRHMQYRKTQHAGKTYALNRKNSEMCTLINNKS